MIKNISIWRAAALAAVLAVISAFSVMASQEPDTERKGAVTIEIRDPDTGKLYERPAEVNLFYIAELTNAEGQPGYRAGDEYEMLGIDFSGLNAERELEIAGQLAKHIISHRISPSSVIANATGKFGQSGLDLGIYLVTYTDSAGELTVTPFLVLLPMKDGEQGDWQYEVVCFPKYEHKNPKPNPKPPGSSSGGSSDPAPPKTQDKTPDMVDVDSPEVPLGIPDTQPPAGGLPQTGLQRLPVAVLGVLGLVFLVTGIVQVGRKGEQDA